MSATGAGTWGIWIVEFDEPVDEPADDDMEEDHPNGNHTNGAPPQALPQERQGDALGIHTTISASKLEDNFGASGVVRPNGYRGGITLPVTRPTNNGDENGPEGTLDLFDVKLVEDDICSRISANRLKVMEQLEHEDVPEHPSAGDILYFTNTDGEVVFQVKYDVEFGRGQWVVLVSEPPVVTEPQMANGWH